MHQAYALAARGFKEIDNPDFLTEPLLYSRDVTVDNGTVTADKQYVYKSERGTIDRVGPPSSSSGKLDDQFAPMLTKGRGGGSRAFTNDHKTDNKVKVLVAPSRPPHSAPTPLPSQAVEKPADEIEDKVMPPPEKPADDIGDKVMPTPEKPIKEKPGEGESGETLTPELKQQLKD